MADNPSLQVTSFLNFLPEKPRNDEFSRIPTTPNSSSDLRQKLTPSLSLEHLLSLSTAKRSPLRLARELCLTEHPALTPPDNRHPHSQPLPQSRLPVRNQNSHSQIPRWMRQKAQARERLRRTAPLRVRILTPARSLRVTKPLTSPTQNLRTLRQLLRQGQTRGS